MGNFDDIRPYRDEEFAEIFAELVQEEEFVSILKYFFQDAYLLYLDKLKSVKTLDEFQVTLIKPILLGIIQASTSNLTYSGTVNIPVKEPCLFISNHRDIVMDPSLIDYGLHLNNVPTVEIAIGDNLLVKPWIEKLVKLNKSFIVRRSLSGRELLMSSKHLSEYIHHSLAERKCYLWIAQREGRAKDGNDHTQEGLLRMLSMAGDSKDVRQSLQPLNIIPVSISYEYDPCDWLKARELWMKAMGKEFIKTPEDDLLNMVTGIRGHKGNVNFHFAPSINNRLHEVVETEPRQQVEKIATIIDEGIYSSYVLSDTHKTAYNMLTGTNTFDIPEQKSEEIKNYFIGQLEKAGLSENELKYIIVQYANPVINYLKTMEKNQK
ncbi:hypothetical protein SDC9_59549 [bioreactor metagenome]|uniref:Phospholipid/glycerol acyltransferase domain-containing protein n=1 Tax=bioreactor metagenome TaxID=1076179 RepID=A0A644XGF3_9ZZZZ